MLDISLAVGSSIDSYSLHCDRSTGEQRRKEAVDDARDAIDDLKQQKQGSQYGEEGKKRKRDGEYGEHLILQQGLPHQPLLSSAAAVFELFFNKLYAAQP